MKAEEIRDKLWDKMPLPFLKDIRGDWDNDLYQWIDDWSAEIAKLCESELATKDARLAVMGQTLTSLREMFADAQVIAGAIDMEDHELRDMLDTIEQAVSAAPKLVWSGKGRADISEFKPDVGDEWEPYTFVECDGATLEIQGQVIEGDGQDVTLYMVIDENQPQEGDGEE